MGVTNLRASRFCFAKKPPPGAPTDLRVVDFSGDHFGHQFITLAWTAHDGSPAEAVFRHHAELLAR